MRKTDSFLPLGADADVGKPGRRADARKKRARRLEATKRIHRTFSSCHRILEAAPKRSIK
jgi:hypothetical protein